MPHLPPESAVAVAQRLDSLDNPSSEPAEPRDPETEAWSRGEQLLAAIRDELNVLHYLYASAHSEKGKGPKWTPERTPRPGVSPAGSTKAAPSQEQLDVLAAHLRRTHQGEHYTTS